MSVLQTGKPRRGDSRSRNLEWWPWNLSAFKFRAFFFKPRLPMGTSRPALRGRQTGPQGCRRAAPSAPRPGRAVRFPPPSPVTLPSGSPAFLARSWKHLCYPYVTWPSGLRSSPPDKTLLRPEVESVWLPVICSLGHHLPPISYPLRGLTDWLSVQEQPVPGPPPTGRALAGTTLFFVEDTDRSMWKFSPFNS